MLVNLFFCVFSMVVCVFWAEGLHRLGQQYFHSTPELAGVTDGQLSCTLNLIKATNAFCNQPSREATLKKLNLLSRTSTGVACRFLLFRTDSIFLNVFFWQHTVSIWDWQAYFLTGVTPKLSCLHFLICFHAGVVIDFKVVASITLASCCSWCGMRPSHQISMARYGVPYTYTPWTPLGYKPWLPNG